MPNPAARRRPLRVPRPGEPLRIAYLVYRGNPHVGGQGVYTRHVTRELAELGHHVEVFTGPPFSDVDPPVTRVEVASMDLYPRDNPFRTALGAMAIAFYVVLLISGGNDVLADKFQISLNAMTWAGRVGVLLLPPLAYFITYRACLALQQHDREVLSHGVETGIIRRLPDGRFIEVHQPLPSGNGNGNGNGHAEVDGHHALDYAGWVVPKKMNRLGALAPTVKGFFYPIEKAAPPAKPAQRSVSSAEEADREEITTGR